MAESVVSITIESLWGLLKQEANLLSGVSDQINKLCTEFRRMQCFLRDAEARQQKEQTVRNWIREIRSLAYRAEDLIETYAIEVSSRRGKGFKKACKRFICILDEARRLHKIGCEIGNIEAEIAGLTSSLQTYGIKAIDQGESSSTTADTEKERWLRMTYPHEIQDSFVGMRDDIEILKSILLDEDMRHRVVSVWGMGGAGKTTVVRKIYNDAGIRSQFDAFAWVCITQQCQVRKVLEDITQQLCSDPRAKEIVNSMADTELVEELYKQQKGKRCLIVLDDLWNTVDWNCLKSAFPIKEYSRSKIMLTTRNEEVAEVGCIHKLNYLSSDEGWELLQKRALIFDNNNLRVADSSVEVEREKIGREMVDKCGYLPLAISVLGGILSKKDSLDEWRVVRKDVDTYLRREGLDEHSGIMQILTLSYDVLPSHLKQCFLSMGHFPEDIEIGTAVLYSTWIAEGIVLPRNQSGTQESLTEAAEQYLAELASRSMVHVELDKYGFRKYSRLHDLMRELCLKKCSEEDFVRVVDLQSGQQQPFLEPSPITMDANTHRMAIYAYKHLDGDAIGNIIDKLSQQLRSIIFTDMREDALSVQMEWASPEIFKKFKCLRVLFFQWYTFQNKKILEAIEKLIHLRYLCLMNCKMEELPLQVLNLPYLQSLNFTDSEWKNPTRMSKPVVVWKAKRLRQFILPDWGAKIVDQGKFRLHGFVQLEEIYNFNTDTMEAADLLKLSNLWKFIANIFGNESLSLILSCIGGNCWPNIREVAVDLFKCNFIETESGTDSNLLCKVFNCPALVELGIEGSLGHKLPDYETNMASRLRMLRLLESEIVEDPMETLEKLPNLVKLVLGTNAFMGKEMVCHQMGFPSLKYLSLKGLHNLEKWDIEEGAMRNLLELKIEECENLVMLPNGLRFIPTLQKIETFRMPTEFKSEEFKHLMV